MNTGPDILSLFSSISVAGILEGFYYLLLLVFVIHAGVLIYHWHTFGTDRKVSSTATIIYLGVGSLLVLFMTSLLSTF